MKFIKLHEINKFAEDEEILVNLGNVDFIKPTLNGVKIHSPSGFILVSESFFAIQDLINEEK